MLYEECIPLWRQGGEFCDTLLYLVLHKDEVKVENTMD